MATLREPSPSPSSPSHLAVQLDLVALHHLLDGGTDIAEPDCSRGKGRGICMRGEAIGGSQSWTAAGKSRKPLNTRLLDRNLFHFCLVSVSA